MTSRRWIWTILAAVAVSSLAGIAAVVAADQGPSQPGSAGHADHPRGADVNDLEPEVAILLLSLAYITDPAMACPGGPCLGGTAQDVARAVIDRCSKVGHLEFSRANSQLAANHPYLKLDQATASACSRFEQESIAAKGDATRLAAAARGMIPGLKVAADTAQAYTAAARPK